MGQYLKEKTLSKGALLLHVSCPKYLITERNLPPAKPMPWFEKFAIEGENKHIIFQAQLLNYIKHNRKFAWATLINHDITQAYIEVWASSVHKSMNIHGYVDTLLMSSGGIYHVLEYKTGKEKSIHHLEVLFYMNLLHNANLPMGAGYLFYERNENRGMKAYEFTPEIFTSLAGFIEIAMDNAEISFTEDIWTESPCDQCGWCRAYSCKNHNIHRIYKRRKRCKNCNELSYGVDSPLGINCAICDAPLKRRPKDE